MSSSFTRDLAARAPVIPVIIIERAADAVPLAEALVAGGLPVLEVTLRTEAALGAIRAMAEVPGGVVGAGTVLGPKDAEAAKAAGAHFAVSPGLTEGLIAGCVAADLPLLPGVSSAGEAMGALERGFDMLKFFPAQQAGGAPFLKALASPLPQITFCPTGGVSAQNAPDYLALPNVACVGGSWVVPQDAIKAGDWGRIEALARSASELAR